MTSFRESLRDLVNLFPPLRYALLINDAICYLFRSAINSLVYIVRQIFRLIYLSVSSIFHSLIRCFPRSQDVEYQRLDGRLHQEPVPYKNLLTKRLLTYHGGLLLGLLLYLFIYYVLVKHHTFTSLTVAFFLMLAYMVVLENSHNIRSILMLCLPVMFTNRGRALIICGMLAIMAAGPLKSSQYNINELHLSLNCCKQYLLIKTDRYIDENVIEKIARVEDVIYNLVKRMKAFADEIKTQVMELVRLALTVLRYMEGVIEELKRIVDVCNDKAQLALENCYNTFENAYIDCREKLGSTLNVICEIVKPMNGLCSVVPLANNMCQLPRAVTRFLDETIGRRLRQYIEIIQNELYVDIDIQHNYMFNGTKSKSYNRVLKEIEFDVINKFWYVHFISRVFNLVSLILVCWILTTATLYHMHYLSDLAYDNMYLDHHLKSIEEYRRTRKTRPQVKVDLEPSSSSGNQESVEQDLRKNQEIARTYLFPMTRTHERMYLKPTSLAMNDTEKHKLYIAGFVWLVFVGYIHFFVLLDFGLFKLIELLNYILDEIMFKGDLPLVDIQSKVGDQVTRYNRTYLKYLRDKELGIHPLSNVTSRIETRGLRSMYRRLVNSIEGNIPDDVAILDSLQECLPRLKEPDYTTYRNLLYLTAITFSAVIFEAYALRMRHCIADLYYPKRARKRAAWLYYKLLAEKPKFEDSEQHIKDENRKDLQDIGFGLLKGRIKR